MSLNAGAEAPARLILLHNQSDVPVLFSAYFITALENGEVAARLVSFVLT